MMEMVSLLESSFSKVIISRFQGKFLISIPFTLQGFQPPSHLLMIQLRVANMKESETEESRSCENTRMQICVRE